jgi:hypothetical protein
MALRINGTVAEGAEGAPPGYGLGASITEHTGLFTRKTAGKCRRQCIIFALFQVVSHQDQAIFRSGVSQGHAANLKIDGRCLGERCDRLGVFMGVLVRSIELLQ